MKNEQDKITGRFLSTKSFEQRFWESVNQKSDVECWEWVASCNTYGYGQIWRREDGYCIPASRASWIIHFGEIPKGMCVCHKCDNPKCVNPHHLFLGTNQDNSSDMVNKGRSLDQQGEKNFATHLTNNDVKTIRSLREQGISQKELAQTFDVSRGTIYRITSHKNWKCVSENVNENSYNL